MFRTAPRDEHVLDIDVTFDWKQLETAVTSAISAGHIGEPRALRVTLHLHDEEDQTEQLLSEVMHTGSRWFGTGPVSSWSSGNRSRVKVTMAKWPNGSSALVSVSHAAGGTGGGDLTLLGSKGSIYHRFGASG